MSAWSRVAMSLLVSACASRTPTARDRAVAQLPHDAWLVAVSDGKTLQATGLKGALEVVRNYLPSTLGCLVDVAEISEAVAIASTDSGTVAVFITRGVVPTCGALSRVAEDTYVATSGSAKPVAAAESVLAPARWERVRPYLQREPFALAAQLDGRQLVVVAQPAPLDAWLAIEGSELERVAAAIRAIVEQPRFASRSHVTQQRGQVIARVDKLEADDLATLVGDGLAAATRRAPAPLAGTTAPLRYEVESTRDTLEALAADSSPFVAGGEVIGIRSWSAVWPFQVGDIVLGVDTRRIASAKQLTDLAAHAGGTIAVAIHRDDVDLAIELVSMH